MKATVASPVIKTHGRRVSVRNSVDRCLTNQMGQLFIYLYVFIYFQRASELFIRGGGDAKIFFSCGWPKPTGIVPYREKGKFSSGTSVDWRSCSIEDRD